MSLNTYQVQKDLTQLLLSSPLLTYVTVKSELKMWLQSDVDRTTLFTTKRNGKVGAGIMVEMPVADNPHANVPGPVWDWTFPIFLIEQRDINMGAGGTGTSSEQLIPIISGLIHHYADNALGTFASSSKALEPVTGFEGCVAYRLNFKINAAKNDAPSRVAPIVITVAGGNCTLSSTTASASIYYTLNSDFPGVGNDGSDSTNLVPTVTYDAITGNYSLTGLVAGWVYYYKPNFNTDTNLVNGTQTLTVAGQFTAQAASVTLNGTVSRQVLAYVGAAAQLYSAPFAVSTGKTIRAAGYKTDLNNSPVSQATT